MATKVAPPEATAVSLDTIKAVRMTVPIVGTTPLIVHRWSEKARRQMLDKMQGRKKINTIRDPQADYEASLYRTDSGYGFPTLGFKASFVGGARFFDKAVTMTALRQFVFFHGVPSADRSEVLTPIIGVPKMREDTVRVGMTTDLRYRGEFIDWTAALDITYVSSAIDQGSVLSLIEAAGMGVGVGEWRPEKHGMNGTFEIDRSKSIETR